MKTNYIAICESLKDVIWAAGDSEEGAKAILWEKVHDYLAKKRTPETSDYSAQELESYFGVTIINTSEGWGYL